MSVLALVARCSELGMPLDRSVIAKLERGLRQSLTLAELLVLARALNVPPLRLVFPVGTAARAEVLPGVEVDTWQAAQWFTGHEAFPADAAAIDDDDAWSDGGDVEQWRQGAMPVTMWRRHADLVARWHQAVQDAAAIRQTAERDRRETERIRRKLAALPNLPDSGGERALGHALRKQADVLETRAQESLRWAMRSESNALDAEEELRELRHDIRSRGLLPPPLAAKAGGLGPTLDHIDNPASVHIFVPGLDAPSGTS